MLLATDYLPIRVEWQDFLGTNFLTTQRHKDYFRITTSMQRLRRAEDSIKPRTLFQRQVLMISGGQVSCLHRGPGSAPLKKLTQRIVQNAGPEHSFRRRQYVPSDVDELDIRESLLVEMVLKVVNTSEVRYGPTVEPCTQMQFLALSQRGAI